MSVKSDGQYKPKIVQGPYKRAYNKKARRILIATLLLVLVFGLIAIIFINNAISARDPDVYVVQKGDTLWIICRKIYGNSEDIREMIWRMRELNGIENPGELQPGMKLYLPVIVD